MKAIFVGGKYNGVEMTTEQIECTRGLWAGTWSPNYSEERYRGACVPRKELDNQPQCIGYLGPMWDGDRLRYETQEVYDLYFD